MAMVDDKWQEVEDDLPESSGGYPMTYKGIVKGTVIELEGEVTLPEGTRVNVIPERPVTVLQYPLTLKEWLREACQVRAQLPKTSDSVEMLRQLREQCANR